MVYVNSGSLKYIGIDGNNWSGIAAGYVDPISGTTNAYTFDFNQSEPHPSHGPLGRRHGFPVRCLDILVSCILS